MRRQGGSARLGYLGCDVMPQCWQDIEWHIYQRVPWVEDRRIVRWNCTILYCIAINETAEAVPLNRHIFYSLSEMFMCSCLAFQSFTTV